MHKVHGFACVLPILEAPPAPALARPEAGHAPALKAPPLSGQAGRGEHCAPWLPPIIYFAPSSATNCFSAKKLISLSKNLTLSSLSVDDKRLA